MKPVPSQHGSHSFTVHIILMAFYRYEKAWATAYLLKNPQAETALGFGRRPSDNDLKLSNSRCADLLVRFGRQQGLCSHLVWSSGTPQKNGQVLLGSANPADPPAVGHPSGPDRGLLWPLRASEVQHQPRLSADKKAELAHRLFLKIPISDSPILDTFRGKFSNFQKNRTAKHNFFSSKSFRQS